MLLNLLAICMSIASTVATVKSSCVIANCMDCAISSATQKPACLRCNSRYTVSADQSSCSFENDSSSSSSTLESSSPNIALIVSLCVGGFFLIGVCIFFIRKHALRENKRQQQTQNTTKQPDEEEGEVFSSSNPSQKSKFQLKKRNNPTLSSPPQLPSGVSSPISSELALHLSIVKSVKSTKQINPNQQSNGEDASTVCENGVPKIKLTSTKKNMHEKLDYEELRKEYENYQKAIERKFMKYLSDEQRLQANSSSSNNTEKQGSLLPQKLDRKQNLFPSWCDSPFEKYRPKKTSTRAKKSFTARFADVGCATINKKSQFSCSVLAPVSTMTASANEPHKEVEEQVEVEVEVLPSALTQSYTLKTHVAIKHSRSVDDYELTNSGSKSTLATSNNTVDTLTVLPVRRANSRSITNAFSEADNSTKDQNQIQLSNDDNEDDDDDETNEQASPPSCSGEYNMLKQRLQRICSQTQENNKKMLLKRNSNSGSENDDDIAEILQISNRDSICSFNQINITNDQKSGASSVNTQTINSTSPLKKPHQLSQKTLNIVPSICTIEPEENEEDQIKIVPRSG